jgi:hypothetical protein
MPRIAITLPKPCGIVFTSLPQSGLYISAIPPTGAAARTGLLKLGDVLMEVQGQSVGKLSFGDSMRVLSEVEGEFVEMVFRRDDRKPRRAESDHVERQRDEKDRSKSKNGSYVVDRGGIFAVLDRICGLPENRLCGDRADTVSECSSIDESTVASTIVTTSDRKNQSIRVEDGGAVTYGEGYSFEESLGTNVLNEVVVDSNRTPRERMRERMESELTTTSGSDDYSGGYGQNSNRSGKSEKDDGTASTKQMTEFTRPAAKVPDVDGEKLQTQSREMLDAVVNNEPVTMDKKTVALVEQVSQRNQAFYVFTILTQHSHRSASF